MTSIGKTVNSGFAIFGFLNNWDDSELFVIQYGPGNPESRVGLRALWREHRSFSSETSAPRGAVEKREYAMRRSGGGLSLIKENPMRHFLAADPFNDFR